MGLGFFLSSPNINLFFKYPKISKNGNPLFFPVCTDVGMVSSVIVCNSFI